MAVTALDRALHDDAQFWLEVNELDEVAAYGIAASLTDLEWDAVDALWRERPVAWQLCFASTLGSAGPARAEGWLLEMIDGGDDELAIQAIEVFRELQRTRERPTAVPPSTIGRIRHLWRGRYRFSDAQLESLLNDMACPRRP